ncbi:MAG: glycogen/starch/alpha-glucan phosphorylase [Gammaproteobacteria bacterium]|nr:glycogen/starch/alpha-glucan phosphorylase [Gammaproteobacteria bacterium]
MNQGIRSNSFAANDSYLLLTDYQSPVDSTFVDRLRWNCMSMLNLALNSKFSSGRSIINYGHNIGKLKTDTSFLADHNLI